MNKYQVVVGNLGTVYDGDSLGLARKDYSEYVKMSLIGRGRVGHEQVTLFEDGEPINEFDGHNFDCKDCEYKHLDTDNTEGHCYMFLKQPEGNCAQFMTLFPSM